MSWEKLNQIREAEAMRRRVIQFFMDPCDGKCLCASES